MAIIELETERETLLGHKECSEYINAKVANLFENESIFNEDSRRTLRNEVEEVFTKEDNEKIIKIPTQTEIKEVLKASNLHAAPGSDELTNYSYLKCFPIIGDTLVEIIQAIFQNEPP